MQQSLIGLCKADHRAADFVHYKHVKLMTAALGMSAHTLLLQEPLNAERAKKEAAAKEAAAARSKAGDKAANDSSQARKAQNGEARDRDRDRDRDRPRDSRNDRDRSDRDRAGADRKDRPPDRSVLCLLPMLGISHVWKLSGFRL